MGGVVTPEALERVSGSRVLKKLQVVAWNGVQKKKSSQQTKGRHISLPALLLNGEFTTLGVAS